MPFRRDGSAEALVPLAVPVCCPTHVTAELNSFAQDVSKSHEVKGHGGHPSSQISRGAREVTRLIKGSCVGCVLMRQGLQSQEKDCSLNPEGAPIECDFLEYLYLGTGCGEGGPLGFRGEQERWGYRLDREGSRMRRGWEGQG